MQSADKKYLSNVRFEHAKECLETAKNLIALNDYKTAANRSYYAVFHAMRSVLAFDGIDMKHHSGIISEFRKLYIKTGIFDIKLSNFITKLFNVRNDSDYDDFYIISKDKVLEQIIIFLHDREVLTNKVFAHSAYFD